MSSSAQQNIIGGSGGYVPVDPKSLEIQELTAWAVNAHNEQNGTKLVDAEAYKAEKQIVNGTNYRIGLEASNGGLRGKYLAEVYVNKNTIKLVDFVQIDRVAVAN